MQWWRRPARIVVPAGLLRWPARLVATLVPAVMVVVGLVGAVLSAHLAERPGWEGVGTLGTELGAVLWFGGAVTLGVAHAPTVLKVVLLAATSLAGAALIAVALVEEWTGPGLDLAMEFGVGAVALGVIDVVLLGVLHRRVDEFARGDTGEITIDLTRWHRP